MKRIILVLIMCLLAGPSMAQIYRCYVDGKVIFSDRPCGGTESQPYFKDNAPKQLYIKNDEFLIDKNLEKNKEERISEEQIKKLTYKSIDIEVYLSSLKKEKRRLLDSKKELEKKLKRISSKRYFGAEAKYARARKESIRTEISNYNYYIGTVNSKLNDAEEELKKIDYLIYN